MEPSSCTASGKGLMSNALMIFERARSCFHLRGQPLSTNGYGIQVVRQPVQKHIGHQLAAEEGCCKHNHPRNPQCSPDADSPRLQAISLSLSSQVLTTADVAEYPKLVITSSSHQGAWCCSTMMTRPSGRMARDLARSSPAQPCPPAGSWGHPQCIWLRTCPRAASSGVSAYAQELSSSRPTCDAAAPLLRRLHAAQSPLPIQAYASMHLHQHKHSETQHSMSCAFSIDSLLTDPQCFSNGMRMELRQMRACLRHQALCRRLDAARHC